MTGKPVEAFVLAVEAAGDPADEQYEARIIRGLHQFGFTIAAVGARSEIDVERLARAIEWMGYALVEERPDDAAFLLAAEYARLAAPPEPAGDG